LFLSDRASYAASGHDPARLNERKASVAEGFERRFVPLRSPAPRGAAARPCRSCIGARHRQSPAIGGARIYEVRISPREMRSQSVSFESTCSWSRNLAARNRHVRAGGTAAASLGTEATADSCARSSPTCSSACPRFATHLLQARLADGLKCQILAKIGIGGGRRPGYAAHAAALAAQNRRAANRCAAQDGLTSPKMAWGGARSTRTQGFPVETFIPISHDRKFVDPKTGNARRSEPGEIRINTARAADPGGSIARADCTDGGLLYEPMPLGAPGAADGRGEISRSAEIPRRAKKKGPESSHGRGGWWIQPAEHVLDHAEQLAPGRSELRKQHRRSARPR